MPNESKVMTLTVNGEDYEVKVAPTETLADVVREKVGLTGTKIMCNQGECGACTVLMDGRPVLSCLTLVVEAEGKHILTVESLADHESGELHPIQQAFVDESGMQCGFCTPGVLLTAKALLDATPKPTEDEVREALAGNLCRCGNYKRITACILHVSEEGRL
jgi:carbon-monoxide dehydrogenase small subunit